MTTVSVDNIGVDINNRQQLIGVGINNRQQLIRVVVVLHELQLRKWLVCIDFQSNSV